MKTIVKASIKNFRTVAAALLVFAIALSGSSCGGQKNSFKIVHERTGKEAGEQLRIDFYRGKTERTKVMDSAIVGILKDIGMQLLNAAIQKAIVELEKYRSAEYAHADRVEHFFDPDATFADDAAINLKGFDFVRTVAVGDQQALREEIAVAGRFEVEPSSDGRRFRLHLKDAILNYSKKKSFGSGKLPPLSMRFKVSLVASFEGIDGKTESKTIGTHNFRILKNFEDVVKDLDDLSPLGSGFESDIAQPSRWFAVPDRTYRYVNNEKVYDSGSIGVVIGVLEGSGF